LLSCKANIKYIVSAIGLLAVAILALYMSNFSLVGEEKPLSPADEAVIHQESTTNVTGNTELVQKIIYLKCNDEELLRTKPPGNVLGLTMHQLQEHYPGWAIDKSDGNEVYMTLKVDGYCQEHTNNMFIGIQEGHIAVFYGKPGSKPIVKEITAIPVNKLVTQDIEELQHGIIVHSKDELLRTLEGMQSR